MPDSAIQCVEVVVAVGPASMELEPLLERVLEEEDDLKDERTGLAVADLVMSIQASEPVTKNTPTEDPARWACMKGIEPYCRSKHRAKVS